MSSAFYIRLAPLAVLLLGALLCLLLEAAGTPVGASKRGRKTHLALVSGGAMSVALAQLWVSSASRVPGGAPLVITGFRFDALGAYATAGILALGVITLFAAMASLRGEDEDRGEYYAMHLLAVAAFACAAHADDWLSWTLTTMWARIALSGMASAQRGFSQSAEAVVKVVYHEGLALACGGMGAALIYGLGGSAGIAGLAPAMESSAALGALALALLAVPVVGALGALPLHRVQVDVAEGFPPALRAFSAAAGALTATLFAARLCMALGDDARAWVGDAWMLCAGLSWTLPAVAALDQRRVGRMIAHLVWVQAGTALAAAWWLGAPGHAFAASGVPVWLAASAAATAGALLSAAPLAGDARGATWELFSGLGRHHPAWSLGFLWLLASAAGVPGTPGFAARLALAQDFFAADAPAVALATLLAPVLAWVPLLRLAIFLFAKAPAGPRATPPPPASLIAMGLAIAWTLGAELWASRWVAVLGLAP